MTNGKARGNLEFLAGDGRDFYSATAIVVSESFATRFRVGPKDEISLPTPSGLREFTIGGVYRDFARDRGTIFMLRELFDSYWQDDRVHSMALALRDPSLRESSIGRFANGSAVQGSLCSMTIQHCVNG